jgi:hypothetical protein
LQSPNHQKNSHTRRSGALTARFTLANLRHSAKKETRPSRRRWHARDAPGQCKRIWPQRRPGGTSPESVCSLWRVQPPMVDAGGVEPEKMGMCLRKSSGEGKTGWW